MVGGEDCPSHLIISILDKEIAFWLSKGDLHGSSIEKEP
jgi:hypothetical protein